MNHQKQAVIRQATAKDRDFLALVVAEAVGYEVMEQAEQGLLTDETREWLGRLAATITDDATLYTWHHALVAEVEGTPVGALICYPGDDYMQRRDHTFQLVADLIDFDIHTMDAETVEGEFYLDSLAVLPSQRGKGIARMLLCEGIRKGEMLHRPNVLACSPENPNARRLYESLGFRVDGERFIFGENYLRMVKD